jgi:hypothetical protein
MRFFKEAHELTDEFAERVHAITALLPGTTLVLEGDRYVLRGFTYSLDAQRLLKVLSSLLSQYTTQMSLLIKESKAVGNPFLRRVS